MAAILLVSSIVILVLFGGTILSVVFTVLYPSIQSIKAIESEGENDDKEWLTYWTIFGLFHLMDEFGGFILSFIPFYFYIRIAFFVFLMAPQTKGALTIYKYVVGPILQNNKA
jgi:receptor expression-enhancing protein 5/6